MRRLSDLVYEVLLDNASGFFSAGNGNYFDGADSVLAMDSLANAITRPRTHTRAHARLYAVYRHPTPATRATSARTWQADRSEALPVPRLAPQGHYFVGGWSFREGQLVEDQDRDRIIRMARGGRGPAPVCSAGSDEPERWGARWLAREPLVRKKRIPKSLRWAGYLLGFAGGALIVLMLLSAFGALVAPDIDAKPTEYSDKEELPIRDPEDMKFDKDNPTKVHVDVPQSQIDQAKAYYPEGKDYVPADLAARLVEQGKLSAWYPRGESPLVAELVDPDAGSENVEELVKAGKLPPVAVRVGPEPIVLKGVDGIGKYGGTWFRAGTSIQEVGHVLYRAVGPGLFQWSPQGKPIRPHFAKSLTQLNDGKEFILTLRKGIRYSDGHELDAGDILYWWRHEQLDMKAGGGAPPPWMVQGGKPGTIEQVGKYSVKFTFASPYGLFKEVLAAKAEILSSPEHYLRQFHPTLGDEKVRARAKAAHGVADDSGLYAMLRWSINPEKPSLAPWIYRRVQTVPPIALVRNPFYPAVDAEGNQLPYIDQIIFSVKMGKMIAQAVTSGKITMQAEKLRLKDYTELMSRRKENGYDIYHWYPGQRSTCVIFPNMVRLELDSDPTTTWKAQLLREKRFRQALSVAIDRRQCIRAENKGWGKPSQVLPGPLSAYNVPRTLEETYANYDPAKANKLLDELWRDLGGDPTRRDSEGYRTFPNGKRMLFYLDYCENTGVGPCQFVVDDWAVIGIRVMLRHRARSLFIQDKNTANFDINVYYSGCEIEPLLSSEMFVPTTSGAYYATRWGQWYYKGGFYGMERARRERGAIPVPRNHVMYKAIEYYEKARGAVTLAEQREWFTKVLDIAAENVWAISISTPPPQLVVVKNGFRNVPRKAIAGDAWTIPMPAAMAPETFYFENESDRRHSPGARAALLESIRTTEPMAVTAKDDESTGWVAKAIRWAILTIVGLVVVLVAARHPYIARRLLIMVPTLLIISISAFIIIQLPPGDFLSARVLRLEEAGMGPEQIENGLRELRRIHHYDEPNWKQYCWWMGLFWFMPSEGQAVEDGGFFARRGMFSEQNAGLLQGNLGRSMENDRKINDIVGDRIVLTFFISLATVLFTWAIAIPIGIYSAVRQYSIGDYVFTLIAFVGMCVPGFLLALVLAALTNIEGLFSAEFVGQPEWTIAKVIDLLKHVWIPVIVMGVTGTAGMIRVMRANLLDELKKPYVTTAMAKGVRPAKLLFKYPVRMALNPFISTIGGLFPRLVSGGSIVAIVLALPTMGPLMLTALFSQDMYTAGSMLIMLSLLGVFGTLVSDLLLLWLDPRIRFQGGSR